VRRLRVLTWHIHGSYLWYLSHVPVDFLLPVKPGRPEGYGGRGATFRWPDNVVEVPADEVADLDVDIVLYQSHRNWEVDRLEILSEAQRRGPQVHLEHDPPRASPTDTRHPVDDPNVLLVHVTHFNDLMWDSGTTPTTVVEHGVVVPPELRGPGPIPRGIVVANGLAKRGRRLGRDLVDRARTEGVPLDIVGMGAEEVGGLGEVAPPELPAFVAQYRFYFHPVRYTSLGLSLCEAMMLGLPVVGLATTELPTVVRNGVEGFCATDVGELVDRMRQLVADPALAARLGAEAHATACERFGIERFCRDWLAVFARVTGAG
jgi:hypothetical protein